MVVGAYMEHFVSATFVAGVDNVTVQLSSKVLLYFADSG
jgi:UDP-3-O-acyl-N-acetylglucosamine deacetylase